MERLYGAEIDERTNAVNMGASAFVLLGGELIVHLLSGRLYKIALKAVENNSFELNNL